MRRTQEAFALKLHGQVEQAGEDLRHAVRALREKMLHERSDRRILRLGHLMLLLGRWNTLMTDLPVRATVARTGVPPPERAAKFQTSGYSTPECKNITNKR